ncbi:response regulator [Paenibacillus thalictri]|uniref:Response regulator n=1 Tax=Paenibacillus thalictri TaxID=2527873 RepID=A0A4Q9DML9_9BACL|nr:response regulator [Paenibacillus thalictri]TBL76537.1 response regulator [Paenibacillus thalictri]
MWKIAIIDDDFNALKGMRNVIPWDELDAQCVGERMDGRKGLELIRSTKPDIVLTDIYMPVMNGLDMIEQLRQDHYPGQIIILSGYSDFDYARRALRLNVNDYLSKPVTIDDIRLVLEKAIQQLEEEELQKLEHGELQSKLMQYEPFAAKEWVKSLVLGSLQKEEIGEQSIPESKRFWRDKSHLVLGIELMPTERLLKATNTDRNLFRFAITNIIEELLQQDWPLSDCVQMHSTYLIVVLHTDPGSDVHTVMEKTRKLSGHIQQCIGHFLRLDVCIGIGSLKTAIEHIFESTEEAYQEVCLQRSGNDAGRGNSFDPEWGKLTVRSANFFWRLADALRMQQEEKAFACIREHMAQLKQLAEPLSPAQLRILAREVWAIITYALYDSEVTVEPFEQRPDHMDAFNTITETGQLEQWLLQELTVIFAQTHRRLKDNFKHKQAVEFMIHYIHENYADDITLDELSAKVFISRYYLNQLFKKATGLTFTNYLIKVRMEKAKKLLAEGNHLIYEVAEMVGYKNVPYFSSLFKKLNGLNPSDILKC